MCTVEHGPVHSIVNYIFGQKDIYYKARDRLFSLNCPLWIGTISFVGQKTMELFPLNIQEPGNVDLFKQKIKF